MVFRKPVFKFGFRSIKKRTARWIISEQEKVPNDKIYPQIPFLIRSKKYKIKVKHENNPAGQLYVQTFAVTDLFRKERIVLNYNKAAEIRPQVERLIVEAMRYGDKHRPTMALANYWLREKNLIHKLFKVLVPRYENYTTAFTALHMLGKDYSTYAKTYTEAQTNLVYHKKGEAVLELRGNDLPPIIRPKVNKSGLLTNILIGGARESYNREQRKQPIIDKNIAIERATTSPSQQQEQQQSSPSVGSL